MVKTYVKKCDVCGTMFRSEAHNAAVCSRECKNKRNELKWRKAKVKRANLTPFDWEYGRYARR